MENEDTSLCLSDISKQRLCGIEFEHVKFTLGQTICNNEHYLHVQYMTVTKLCCLTTWTTSPDARTHAQSLLHGLHKSSSTFQPLINSKPAILSNLRICSPGFSAICCEWNANYQSRMTKRWIDYLVEKYTEIISIFFRTRKNMLTQLIPSYRC